MILMRFVIEFGWFAVPYGAAISPIILAAARKTT
jgi:hypothetical protein